MRRLLGDLAAEESKHYELAEKLNEKQKASGASNKESESERRRFVLQIVQPGLAGLMDGSVSTLAPVFAAAFATHSITCKGLPVIRRMLAQGSGLPWARHDALTRVEGVLVLVDDLHVSDLCARRGL